MNTLQEQLMKLNIVEKETEDRKVERQQCKHINNKSSNIDIKRGDMWYINLPYTGKRGEQHGVRPCLVIQNNTGNTYSPTIIVACITSKTIKYKKIPTHALINGFGLKEESVVLLEQIKTVSKERFLGYIGHVDEFTMKRVDRARDISMGETTRPIDRLNEEQRNIIEEKLKYIYSYENIIFTSKNDRLLKHLLNEREMFILELERYCKNNYLDYKDYYVSYQKRDMVM